MARFKGEDFKAILMDGILYVNGRVTAPNPSYSAGFHKAIPQGIVETQLILDFGWFARPGTWTQQQVEIPVVYTIKNRASQYSTVLLRDREGGYEFELEIEKKEKSTKKLTLALFKPKSDLGATHMVVVDPASGGCSVMPIGTPPQGYMIHSVGTKAQCRKICPN